MGECRECRFWLTTPEPLPDGGTLGNDGLCQRREEDGQRFWLLAYLPDQPGHTTLALFVTAPDFGCVQFAPREPT